MVSVASPARKSVFLTLLEDIFVDGISNVQQFNQFAITSQMVETGPAEP